MNIYELTYIIPVKTGENNISSIQSRVEGVLSANGCIKQNINNSYTSAQKRKFSYEIGKEQFGYYITIYFEADPLAIEKVSKALKLDSDILRYLIVSVKGDIPQGVVVSKKEVEQQIDNAIEDMIQKSKDIDLTESKEINITENRKEPETKKTRSSFESELRVEDQKPEETDKLEEADGKKDAKKKEPKKKANFEDLDKKLDEILK